MRAVIIAKGDPPTQRDIDTWIRKHDVLICADGGARAALQFGLKPIVVVGDFDSLSENELAQLEKRGSQLLPHPRNKDETDLELALLLSQTLFDEADEENEIVILGALGGRIDHELANMLLLAMPQLKGRRVVIAHRADQIRLIDARDVETSLELRGNRGDVVSLLPFGGDAHGIQTSGLEYSLHGESLFVGPARGVSNVMLGEVATVALKRGMLLCIHRRKTNDDGQTTDDGSHRSSIIKVEIKK
jgi:thiamine pyrophosphokinase